MFKRRLCTATFKWTLSCTGPLLIADGRYDKKKLAGTTAVIKNNCPTNIFISHNDITEVEKAIEDYNANAGKITLLFYVPGTSIRGPFRAQAERILRSLGLPGQSACDPFHEDDSCSKRLSDNSWPVPYKEVCPACKLFGCAGLRSRAEFTDADINQGYKSVYRDMIGIDRFTGGVFTGGTSGGGANMRFHALENTTFTTTVTVDNFELWHLGLMAYVFKDFEDGLVQMGFGKSKGFGLVKGNVEELTLMYPANLNAGVHHLGSLAADEKERYGFHDAGSPVPGIELEEITDGVLSLYKTYKVKNVDLFMREVAESFNASIGEMKKEVKAR